MRFLIRFVMRAVIVVTIVTVTIIVVRALDARKLPELLQAADAPGPVSRFRAYPLIR